MGPNGDRLSTVLCRHLSLLTVRRRYALLVGTAGLIALGLIWAASFFDGLDKPAPSTVLAPLTRTLPPLTLGDNYPCAGVALSGRITLGARLTAGQGPPTAEAFGLTDRGLELSIYWPPGYRAVFDPAFSRVLAPNDEVFATAGEDLNNPAAPSGRVVCFSANDALPNGIAISIWPEGPVSPWPT